MNSFKYKLFNCVLAFIFLASLSFCARSFSMQNDNIGGQKDSKLLLICRNFMSVAKNCFCLKFSSYRKKNNGFRVVDSKLLELFKNLDNLSFDKIDELLNLGANINLIDCSRETVLYKACNYGSNIETVKSLLLRGAIPNEGCFKKSFSRQQFDAFAGGYYTVSSGISDINEKYLKSAQSFRETGDKEASCPDKNDKELCKFVDKLYLSRFVVVAKQKKDGTIFSNLGVGNTYKKLCDNRHKKFCDCRILTQD